MKASNRVFLTVSVVAGLLIVGMGAATWLWVRSALAYEAMYSGGVLLEGQPTGLTGIRYNGVWWDRKQFAGASMVCPLVIEAGTLRIDGATLTPSDLIALGGATNTSGSWTSVLLVRADLVVTATWEGSELIKLEAGNGIGSPFNLEVRGTGKIILPASEAELTKALGKPTERKSWVPM